MVFIFVVFLSSVSALEEARIVTLGDEGKDPQVLISNIKICAKEEREADAPKVKMKGTS